MFHILFGAPTKFCHSSTFDELGDGHTGYSVPFTETVRNKPRIRTGRHFRRVCANLGMNGSVRYLGFLIIGNADTSPCENTKDPTPKSILISHRTVSQMDQNRTQNKTKQKTHKGYPVGLTFHQITRKDWEIHSQDAYESQQQHMCPICCQRR